MSKKKTLYEELGVDRTATKEEIKRAYRKKAAKLHPDVNKDKSAVEDFKRVCQAYMVLYDDQSRYKYDKTGEEEKPSDRKPIDIEEQARTFVIRAVFALIDKLGDSLSDKNLQKRAIEDIDSVLREVKTRLNKNKIQWKASKNKEKQIEKKMNAVSNKTYLHKILKMKLNHISTQEILPCREQHRSLLIDKKVIKRAKEILVQECTDDTIETKLSQADIYSDWDRQMNRTDIWLGSTSV